MEAPKVDDIIDFMRKRDELFNCFILVKFIGALIYLFFNKFNFDVYKFYVVILLALFK